MSTATHAAKDPAKIDRFRRLLAESAFDAVVAVSPENTWYLSDAVIDTQRSLLERLAIVVWAKGREPIYIVCTNEEIQARRDSWITDLRGYVEYQQSPMTLAAEAVRELGAARGRIGIEKHYLNARYFEELTTELPHAALIEARSFFDRVRAVKTPAEVRILEDAAQVTDRAIRQAFEAARPGMKEREVGVAMGGALVLGGAEMQAFQVLAAAANSCSTHHRAGDYVLKSGDLFRTDFGGVFSGGYLSDLARTICVGKPSRKQIDIYKVIWDENERLIAMMRPGVSARDLYFAHRQAWEALGWPMKRPHIGHSLGIGLHEHPVLMPSEDWPLEPGMCLSVEPNYLIPGVEKYHVEDLVLVTEGAPRVLSRSADWSELLTPGA